MAGGVAVPGIGFFAELAVRIVGAVAQGKGVCLAGVKVQNQVMRMRCIDTLQKWSWKSWFCTWLFGSLSINAAAEIENKAITPFAIAYLIAAMVVLALFVWSCLKTWDVRLTIVLVAALIAPATAMLIFNGSFSRFLVYIYFIAVLLTMLICKYGRSRKKQ